MSLNRQILLKASNITKRWPGVVALDNVDFCVYAGAVNVLVGENGAGKSTLMNIISGAYSQYEGQLSIDGKAVSFASTADAARQGIAMVHQELNLIPSLSVAENLFLGREPLTSIGLVDYRTMHRRAVELLRLVEFECDTHLMVGDLKVGEQQMIEIAKALSFDARILIMDEPTSSLSEHETDVLFRLVDRLKSKGVGIVYITHKMNELSRLADCVTILRDGKLISESEASQLTVDDIVRQMVGRDRKELFVKSCHSQGDVLLRVDRLSLHDSANRNRYRLRDVSFEVRAGEVLGLYGLMGAGRSEIVESVFGINGDLTEGSITVAGRTFMPSHPAEAIAAGIALIPEDRKGDGLVLDMDITRNITLASLEKVLRGGAMSRAKEQSAAEHYRDQLTIKSHSLRQSAGELSGGNQQKVVLSKWLMTEPTVLLLDEPTRGIDIGAKNEIYKLIDRLAGEGRAVVVVSSELPEIMALSDRIITICGGKVTAVLDHTQFSEEAILRASLPQTE